MWLEFTKRQSYVLYKLLGFSAGKDNHPVGVKSCQVCNWGVKSYPRQPSPYNQWCPKTPGRGLNKKIAGAEYPSMTLFRLSDVKWPLVTFRISYQRAGDCGEVKSISRRVYVAWGWIFTFLIECICSKFVKFITVLVILQEKEFTLYLHRNIFLQWNQDNFLLRESYTSIRRW